MGKVKDHLWCEPEFYSEDYPYSTSNNRQQTGLTDMNISEMSTSNYLKREDVNPAILVTVARDVEKKDVSMADQPADMKFCLHFIEVDKPLVLNQTNQQLVAMATGSTETTQWIGKKIVLFDDPNVSFAGKIVGGIRVRAPKNQQAPVNPPAQQATAQQYADQSGGFVDSDLPDNF